jgi:hypothetical protein
MLNSKGPKPEKPKDDNRPMTWVRFAGLEFSVDRDADGKQFVEFKVPVTNLPDAFNKALNALSLTEAQTDEVRGMIYNMSVMNVFMAHKV